MEKSMLDILSKYKAGVLTFRDAGCIRYIKGDTLLNVNGDKWSEARIENCAIDVPFGLIDFPISCDVDGCNYIHPGYIIKKCSYLESLISIETKEPKRTKESYEKRDYSTAWQAAKDHEERVEFLYRQSDLGEAIKGNNWKAIQSPSEAAQYHFDLYRKIETPIEWWEDAVEFVKPLGHSEIVNGQLLVEAAMTRDQWCDFARILLEQGE